MDPITSAHLTPSLLTMGPPMKQAEPHVNKIPNARSVILTKSQSSISQSCRDIRHLGCRKTTTTQSSNGIRHSRTAKGLDTQEYHLCQTMLPYILPHGNVPSGRHICCSHRYGSSVLGGRNSGLGVNHYFETIIK